MTADMWQFDAGSYIDVSLEKIHKTAERMKGFLPGYYHNDNGQWRNRKPGGWTDGFFPAMLYYGYCKTKDEVFLSAARAYDDAFTTLIHCDNLDHDVGFLYSLKDVFDYRLTGSRFHKERALHAADILLARYNENAGIIPAWDFHPMYPDVDYRGRIIADTMLNLPLLCWASDETKNEAYRNAAVAHGRSAQKNLVRPDGSSFHVFDFNPQTGEPVGGKTMQGYSDDSCWARGQSWIIYGFALLYKNTGIESFLQTAMHAAQYFVEHMPAYGVPLWDFAVSGFDYAPWDSSAGAITVCGLLEICKHVKNRELRNYYYQNAVRIMHGLTDLCSTMRSYHMEPLLLHGNGSPAYKKGTEQVLAVKNPDVPMIFGDYYYLEALMRFENEAVILPW